MTKLQELKEAIKRTPPDRLAKIEYQSHFMQMLGVSIVSGILIYKGFWWVIFAFIFSIFISLSQGIGAYQKYHAIRNIMPQSEKYDPKKDKSFTRKRDYYIRKTFGKYMWILAVFSSIWFNLTYIPYNNWWQSILFSFSIIFVYLVIYFFFFYKLVKFVRWLES